MPALPDPVPGSVRGLVGRLGGPDRMREILAVFYDRGAGASPVLSWSHNAPNLVGFEVSVDGLQVGRIWITP